MGFSSTTEPKLHRGSAGRETHVRPDPHSAGRSRDAPAGPPWLGLSARGERLRLAGAGPLHVARAARRSRQHRLRAAGRAARSRSALAGTSSQGRGRERRCQRRRPSLHDDDGHRPLPSACPRCRRQHPLVLGRGPLGVHVSGGGTRRVGLRHRRHRGVSLRRGRHDPVARAGHRPRARPGVQPRGLPADLRPARCRVGLRPVDRETRRAAAAPVVHHAAPVAPAGQRELLQGRRTDGRLGSDARSAGRVAGCLLQLEHRRRKQHPRDGRQRADVHRRGQGPGTEHRGRLLRRRLHCAVGAGRRRHALDRMLDADGAQQLHQPGTVSRRPAHLRG